MDILLYLSGSWRRKDIPINGQTMALKHFKSEEKLQFLQVNLTVLCSKPICNNFQLGEKKKSKAKAPKLHKKPCLKILFYPSWRSYYVTGKD